MSDHRLELDVVDRDGAAVAECPRCGEIVNVNRHDCDGELAFDGTCPMCGDPYDSFLDHLEDCDGGG